MASIQRIGFSRSQNDLSKIFKALGHPARLAILDLLVSKDKLICKELSYKIGLSSPTVTHHLQILMDSGLIGYEKDANMTFYIVNPLLLSTAVKELSSVTQDANDLNYNYSNTTFAQQPMPDSW